MFKLISYETCYDRQFVIEYILTNSLEIVVTRTLRENPCAEVYLRQFWVQVRSLVIKYFKQEMSVEEVEGVEHSQYSGEGSLCWFGITIL